MDIFRQGHLIAPNIGTSAHFQHYCTFLLIIPLLLVVVVKNVKSTVWKALVGNLIEGFDFGPYFQVKLCFLAENVLHRLYYWPDTFGM